MGKSVAILGCGPAGLLAAHAAALSDWNFRIFSKKRPSQLFGCQYLHEPIPGITRGAPKRVTYGLVGTPEGYRDKVYGKDFRGTVSPEDLDYHHYAWDIREAYRLLWSMYSEDVVPHEISPTYRKFNGFDLVISTLPRKLWAEPGDRFESKTIWAVGDAPELGRMVPFRPAEDFTVICDGTEDVSWYRSSQVFGYSTIEWPAGNKPPVEGVSLVEKPISHNSKAASDMLHLGRYGKWEKGVLTTDAFREALKAFENDSI